MIKRLLLLTTLGVLLSGCFMVPMALVGPAVSGFSTASITQSAFTTGASYMVKKNTGKTIAEHAYEAIGGDASLMKQSYFPENNVTTLILPESKPIQ
tara:strand:- start:191 stop:481 length:291 start_codon:yes stop_codon:yes gene_type:complete